MSDNDLIRRGDVMDLFDDWWLYAPSGQQVTNDVCDAIAALPAVTVGVKPDAIREAALREAANAGADAAFNYWAEAEKPVSQRKFGGAGLPASVSLAILALITEKPHDRA